MKARVWILTGLIVLALTVVACTRSASKAPATVAETGGTVSSGEGGAAGEGGQQVDVMATMLAQGQMTQTAIAAQMGGGAGEGTGGGEGPTNTPSPEQQPPTPTLTPTPVPQATSSAATPVPTSVASTGEVPESYTLHEGEFPYCLARRFNVDPDELLSLNGMSRGQQVYAGTTLRIPKGGKTFPAERALLPHPTTYTVVAGDTLYSIACKFGDVWPEDIANANGLSLDASLTAGTTLQIP